MLPLIAATCLTAAGPAALLDANRVATPAPSRGTLVQSYRYRSEGMAGSASSIIDLAYGWYVERHQAGLSTDSEGFDGGAAWMQDLSGFSSLQEGGNKPALATNKAYRNANLWWRADRGGATIKAVDCNTIEVRPRGGQMFQARFDPTTHLLSSVREQYIFGHVRQTRFTDYRACGPALSAGRIEVTSDDDSSTTQLFELEKCSLASARASHAFAIPRAVPSDWSLPPQGEAVLPMRPHDTDIMINARINGRGPYLFYLDTGGHNILSPRLAKELGLRVVGDGRSGGAGENTVQTGYARVAEINAGGAVLKDQTVAVLETSPPEVVGELIGGVLGVEFFERFVTKIDYERNSVTFEDPRRFDAKQRRTAGVAVPFKLYDHMPQVAGKFDGIRAFYNIDTGSGQFVDMTRPFVEANNLRARYSSAVTIVSGFGAGGASRSTIARARSLSLGALEVTRVPAGLSTDQRGSFSDPVYSGNVGNGVLRRFRVTFDYPHQVMYLERVAKPDLSAYGFNRTGMTLVLQDGKPKVVDVAPGTPAASSGIELGDIVTSIGGVDVLHLPIGEVRQMLKRVPVGEPLTVTYMRGGALRSASLVPRDLVPD